MRNFRKSAPRRRTGRLNESSQKPRIKVDYMGILDHIAKQPAGKFVSFGYVSFVDTIKQRKNLDTVALKGALSGKNGGRYDALRSFADDENSKNNPIRLVCKISRYVLNWCTPERYSRLYGKHFADRRSELNLKYREKYPNLGIQQTDGQTAGWKGADNGYGTKSGAGDHANQLYVDQNTAHAKIDSTYFFIGDNGEVSEPCDEQVAKTMIARKGGVSLPAIVKKEFDDVDKADYEQLLKGIYSKFRPQTFDFDKILYIVSTDEDGTAYYYINEKVLVKGNLGTATKPIDIRAAQPDLVRIAEDALEDAINASIEGLQVAPEDLLLDESKSSKVMFREKMLRRAMNESLRRRNARLINEGFEDEFDEFPAYDDVEDFDAPEVEDFDAPEVEDFDAPEEDTICLTAGQISEMRRLYNAMKDEFESDDVFNGTGDWDCGEVFELFADILEK